VQDDRTWAEFVAAHPLDTKLEEQLAGSDQILDRLEELGEAGREIVARLAALSNAVFDYKHGVLLDPNVLPVEGWDDENDAYTG
jgi:hypothetical protein